MSRKNRISFKTGDAELQEIMTANQHPENEIIAEALDAVVGKQERTAEDERNDDVSYSLITLLELVFSL